MKKHNGMRPQDVVILLKITAFYGRYNSYDSNVGPIESVHKNGPLKKEIAAQLGISASEVTESLARSTFAGLYDPDRKKVMARAFFEFLQHGFKYVFPQQPGPLVRGVPTAHSAKPLSDIIQSNEPYVWPSAEGTVRGQGIEPLYPNAVNAAKADPLLYELLALVDSIRVGKAREVNLAVNELQKRLLLTE